MDINTISKYVDLTHVKNLSNLYVVVKKYTNVTYYYGCVDPSRPGKYAHSSRWKNANRAILFANKDEAQRKCDELNAQRKRIKFKVDDASKHFVSNFSLQFNSYSEKNVKLINNPVSLQDYKEGKEKVNTNITKEMVNEVSHYLNKMSAESKNFVDNIGQITLQKMRELEADYNKRVAELNTRLAYDLQVHENKLNVVKNVTKFLVDGTIEKLVSSNKTINDNKFEILYGNGGSNGNS